MQRALVVGKKQDGSGWRFAYDSEFLTSCRIVGQPCCKPFPALLVFAVTQLFDILIDVSDGSLQVFHQRNPRNLGLSGHVCVRVPLFILGSSFPSVAYVRWPSVDIRLPGSPDVLSELVYLFLELILFSGFGGESGVSVVVLENLWGFVSSECIPRFSMSSELFPLCLAVITHINNPVLRGHRPHPPELIGVSACEGLLQLALNLREMFLEAVLKSVLFVDFDLLVGWAFVVRRSVEIDAALLLLVYALYAHLSEPLPVEAPWLSCNENRG